MRTTLVLLTLACMAIGFAGGLYLGDAATRADAHAAERPSIQFGWGWKPQPC